MNFFLILPVTSLILFLPFGSPANPIITNKIWFCCGTKSSAFWLPLFSFNFPFVYNSENFLHWIGFSVDYTCFDFLTFSVCSIQVIHKPRRVLEPVLSLSGLQWYRQYALLHGVELNRCLVWHFHTSLWHGLFLSGNSVYTVVTTVVDCKEFQFSKWKTTICKCIWILLFAFTYIHVLGVFQQDPILVASG